MSSARVRNKSVRAAAAVTLLLLPGIVGGCKVGPNYHTPAAALAPSYKETAQQTPPPELPGGGWKPAQPGDETLRSKWWEIYADPQLNALEERVSLSNQSLKASLAQYTQALAVVRQYRASYFPTLGVNPSFTRAKLSSNRPLRFNTSSGSTYNDLEAGGQSSWEPDLWGAIRRTVQQARDNAQASAAELANADLSIRSELCMDYLELRGLDTQTQILNEINGEYERYLSLTQTRFRGGVATESDVAQARTQLDQVRTQSIDLGVARAQYENAIATLTGQPASTFTLPVNPLILALPTVPVAVPSEMLERRPDVAAAERRAAAANEQIGIAVAAYYPRINLTGSGGFQASRPGILFQGPSAIWTLGGSASEILFDAGRRHAISDQARAAYEAQVANYRQTVLRSFQDVENQLAALTILSQEATAQQHTLADAERSVAISTQRYKGGVTTSLEVITAQAIALTNRRAAADITTRQFAASVQLVKSLGGGWDPSQLPRP